MSSDLSSINFLLINAVILDLPRLAIAHYQRQYYYYLVEAKLTAKLFL